MVPFSIYHWGVNQKFIGEASNLFGGLGVQNIVGELEQPVGELLSTVCLEVWECLHTKFVRI